VVWTSQQFHKCCGRDESCVSQISALPLQYQFTDKSILIPRLSWEAGIEARTRASCRQPEAELCSLKIIPREYRGMSPRGARASIS